MLVRKIIWPRDRVEHIARHAVTPDEVEDVCFAAPLILRTKSEGDNPVYNILGQTIVGRYLVVVIIALPDGNGYPITARPMTSKERRRYQKWKNR